MVLIVCSCSFIFATLDSNVGEVEGEEVDEGFEEDHGVANQGKPSFDLLMLYYLLLLFIFLLSLSIDPSWVDSTYVDTMHTYPKYV
jgi:hypothetical protein